MAALVVVFFLVMTYYLDDGEGLSILFQNIGRPVVVAFYPKWPDKALSQLSSVPPHQAELRETAYVYEFSPCPGVDLASELATSFSYRGKGDYRIDIDWKLNGSFNSISAILDIKKCPTRALVDCEQYIKFPVHDVCTGVHNELNYSRLLYSIEPPVKSCPLQGHYKVRDFPIIGEIPDVKRILGFGFIPDNKILTCDFSIVAENETLLCIRLSGSFRLMKGSSQSKS